MGASGSFVDSFGMVTALFSALAFSVVAVSLHFQRRDLGLAQQEFRDTRTQMERSQRENNFFQLFRAQMEIVAEMRIVGRLTYKERGVQKREDDPCARSQCGALR